MSMGQTHVNLLDQRGMGWMLRARTRRARPGYFSETFVVSTGTL